MNFKRIFTVTLLTTSLSAQAQDQTVTEDKQQAFQEAEHAEQIRQHVREAQQQAQERAQQAQQHAQQARQQELQRLEAEKRAALQRAQAQQEEARRHTQIIKEELQQTHARERAERSAIQAENEAQRLEERQKLETMRQQLSQTHRELREASREVARLHREVERANVRTVVAPRLINLGDRAVIGIVMGGDTDEGVEILGVSPGGPAEAAGLAQGDIIVSINGTDLAFAADTTDTPRERVQNVMRSITADETVDVIVSRDGAEMPVSITAKRREPLVWQSLITIPPTPPVAPDVPTPATEPMHEGQTTVVVDFPDIDVEALTEQVERVQQYLVTSDFLDNVVTVTSDFQPNENIVIRPGNDYQFHYAPNLGAHALGEATLWFGTPLTRGLEMATVNSQLGEYFNTDEGVLILNAEEDNQLELESGDVVLELNDIPVATPRDLIRTLRDLRPWNELEVKIKRNKRNKTLNVSIDDERLGHIGALFPKKTQDSWNFFYQFSH